MKYGIAGLMLAGSLVLLAGCGNSQKTGLPVKKSGVTLSGYSGNLNQGVLEIKEKMFLAQTNEVYLNPEDYIGRTLKLEGIFISQEDYTVKGDPYYFVIRNGPGCCAGDGTAGFEVMWENPGESYPQPNDWVEAIGVLGSYEEDGYPYLCINLSSLTVLEKRGAEFVTQ